MHRFTLDDYLLQITKEKEVANPYREKGYLQMQRKKWLNWLHSILGRGLGSDFRKLL